MRSGAASLAAGLALAGQAAAQFGLNQCVGDVCVGPNLGSTRPNWSKSPFPHCPTASNGGCGQPTSTVNREVRCEHGTGARTAGLAGWLPVEYAQTEASYGGILTYKEDDMQFTAPMAMINLDGNLDDWQCAPIKAQTPFYPFNKVGTGPGPAGATFAEGTHCCGDELTMFDDRDGLTWNALDQSSAISFAWDAGNFYIGVKVVDDSHENAAGSGWNGDSVQIAFTDSQKQRITHLYNYVSAAAPFASSKRSRTKKRLHRPGLRAARS